MSEVLARPPHLKRKRRVRVVDVIYFLVIVIISAVLLNILFTQLRLKHEVSSATTVTNQVIGDIAKQNAADARSLGDKSFQAAHSTKQLQSLFKSASVFTKGTSTIVRQTVTNTSKSQNVAIVYKYGSKTPYYFRVVVTKAQGNAQWHLVGIGGNPSESALTAQ